MDMLFQAPLTLCMVKAGLAAGTTSTFSTTGATVYSIRGKAYSVAAATNGATPTTDANTVAAFPSLVANQGAIVVFGYNAAGAVKCMQGNIQALDATGNFILAPQFPPIPDTVTPFGYLVLKAGSTLVGTFIFGTNNLSAVTGMTYAFQDVVTLTDRPQVS
jgi:hypothetical protein